MLTAADRLIACNVVDDSARLAADIECHEYSCNYRCDPYERGFGNSRSTRLRREVATTWRMIPTTARTAPTALIDQPSTPRGTPNTRSPKGVGNPADGSSPLMDGT